MGRFSSLALWSLTTVLLVLPLLPRQPGLPRELGPTEATYWLMSESLLEDVDLRFEASDNQRLFGDFPASRGIHLWLRPADDGQQPPNFALPVLYPLLSVPLTAVLGSNGPVALNMLMALLTLWLAYGWLRRESSDAPALLFAVGFVLLSAAFVDVFERRPEPVLMGFVAAAFYLAWGTRESRSIPLWRGAIAGALLGAVCSQQATLLWLVLLFLGESLLARRFKFCITMLAAGAVAFLLLATLSWALVGELDPLRHGDIHRAVIEHPLEPPTMAPEPLLARQATLDLPGLRNAFIGRFSGLLPYYPFAGLALLFFALAPRRRRVHWRLLATLALFAATLLTSPPVPGLGSGFGDPRWAAAYPAFLFLIPRLGNRVLITASYGLGALFLMPSWLTPYGSPVPYAGHTAHTRNPPFPWLPFEADRLGDFGIYRSVAVAGGKLWARSDEVTIVGDEARLLGGTKSELWLETPEPVGQAVFSLRSVAPRNEIALDFGGTRQASSFIDTPVGGEIRHVRLAPKASRTRVSHPGASFGGTSRDAQAGRTHLYRLGISSEHGALPGWRGSALDDGHDHLFLGAALSYLGPAELVDRELYAARWEGCVSPSAVAAGESFLVLATLENASAESWPASGAARVRLAYRWLDEAGQEIPENGLRTDLEMDVAPGDRIVGWQQVKAPERAGKLTLETDLLFENVAWFSSRAEGQTCRAEVEIRLDQG